MPLIKREEIKKAMSFDKTELETQLLCLDMVDLAVGPEVCVNKRAPQTELKADSHRSTHSQ